MEIDPMVLAIYGPPPEGLDLDETSVVKNTAVVLTLLFISALFLAGRIAIRTQQVYGLSLDDYAILLSWLFVAATAAMVVVAGQAGAGKHVWALKIHQLVETAKLTYVFSFLFATAVFTTKVSILLFYRRVFTRGGVTFRVAFWFGTILVMSYPIIFAFTMGFSCRPLSHFWTQVEGTEGTCIDVGRFFVILAIINLATNVIVLLIPIPEVLKLQMSKGKKAAVFGIMALGGLVCVASAIRVYYLDIYSTKLDSTWAMGPIVSYAHDGYYQHPFARFELPLGQYELTGINQRKILCSLRSVNKLFHQLVTPVLFQHVVISGRHVFGINSKENSIADGSAPNDKTRVYGAQRLQRVAKQPFICKLVRRLEISLIIREVDHYADYKPTDDEEEIDLVYIGRLAVIIHSTLPRFTNLKVLKLNFEDIPYNHTPDYEVMDGIGNGNARACWVEDTKNLFESFATAMCRSGLDKLEELDLSLPLACDFGHFLDDGNEPEGYSKAALFQQLKRLRLDCVGVIDYGEGLEFRFEQPNSKFDVFIRRLLPLAPNLESLAVEASDVLDLDSSSLASFRLQRLYLSGASPTAVAFVNLFRRSTALCEVILRGVYIGSGTWEEALSALSQTSITYFYIETCGYQMEGESSIFIPADDGEQSGGDCSCIETNRAADLEACESVFARVHQNMRRIHGDSYDEVAAEENRKTQHGGKLGTTASMGMLFDFRANGFEDDYTENENPFDNGSLDISSEDDASVGL
ncbi:hypothetical protein FHETE_5771 [Fusarium heterosporum]|uniref:Rhodopsin domain-containing protein n=1 Tax=Fusarium heterosporum TaxID=42747 RepID=A0A8H5WQY1_FUSHE|nr:hypothetical protein FHETE_5771 [Fusarium heterosporum]